MHVDAHGPLTEGGAVSHRVYKHWPSSRRASTPIDDPRQAARLQRVPVLITAGSNCHQPFRVLPSAFPDSRWNMPFEDLREFISTLEKRGQLKHIRAEVEAELEIAEITDRVSKLGGPALLFENVRGHSIPVLINALGSRERMMIALGVSDY